MWLVNGVCSFRLPSQEVVETTRLSCNQPFYPFSEYAVAPIGKLICSSQRAILRSVDRGIRNTGF